MGKGNRGQGSNAMLCQDQVLFPGHVHKEQADIRTHFRRILKNPALPKGKEALRSLGKFPA